MAKRSRESLLRAMQDANITGAEIARALDVTDSRISQLLSGDRMQEDQIKGICDKLGISADVIIYDKLGRISDSYDAEILKLYRELPPEWRVMIVQVMRLVAEKKADN